jgi:RHS repeat-associated protein
MKTKYFFGNYEKEITPSGTRELNTIPGFDGNYALIELKNGQRTTYYVYTDHLGSAQVITNSSGTAIEWHNFDAWGRERNPQTWEYLVVEPVETSITDRGYTGREMLSQFGIINMNGRLYDPTVGRMLSPDPYIQAPGNTQNYNRYSYVLNNPLKYSD